MTKTYPCLCQAIGDILRCSRWIGILPIVPNKNKPNHFTSGCSFYISKFWLTTSIIIQVTLGIYSVVTTTLQIFYYPDETDEPGFERIVMTLGYITMETDSLVSLFGGTFYSGRIAKTLVRLSRLDGKVSEMRELACQLRKILIFLIVTFCIRLFSFMGVAWTRMEKYPIIPLERILDSPLAVLMRGLSGIFPNIQCALVLMMCLVISSKFKHQAETIKLTLDHVAFYATAEQTRSVKVRTATVKWMGHETDNANILHLERISDQYKETHLCLEEVNHCIGIQLLVTLTANLFITVYYLYRYISASNNSNVIINIQQRIHCMVSLLSLFVKLILYMYVGYKLKTQSRKPAKALQHAKLLRLPTLLREQIQCLILQWLSSETGGLSAFNVINVGPWLLAPIAGNVITYLLVAIQFKTNMSSVMPANLTAILESVF